MIIFYQKSDGKIFATTDGRVHDEKQLNSYVDNGSEIGKYIIGWIEKDGQKIEYNMDKFEILQRFEDNTSFSPLDCEIQDGNLIIK